MICNCMLLERERKRGNAWSNWGQWWDGVPAVLRLDMEYPKKHEIGMVVDMSVICRVL